MDTDRECFEISVLRRISEPERKEVKGVQKITYREAPLYIIRVIKSRKM
jgi:hypothetical protein